jgi:hypothetical protein
LSQIDERYLSLNRSVTEIDHSLNLISQSTGEVRSQIQGPDCTNGVIHDGRGITPPIRT